jgi:hypothetical protein
MIDENVPVDALKALANLPGPSGGPTAEAVRVVTATDQTGEFDVGRWLDDHGVKVVRKEPWNGGTRWILGVCPFNPERADSDKAIVGQLPNGTTFATCQHANCAGNDPRDAFDAGRRDRQPNRFPRILEDPK